MTCHLGALVPGDRSQQGRWEIAEPVPQRLVQALAVAAGEVQEPDQSGRALDERADRRALVSADDQVALPVPCLAAIFNRRGPLMDCEHRLLKARAAAICSLLSAAVI